MVHQKFANWTLVTLLLSACTSTSTVVEPPPPPTDDYYAPTAIHFDDRVYSPSVRTVQMIRNGDPLAPAIIELGTPDRLLLRFDDLSAQASDLSYTVVHCTADWMPSGLLSSQFLDGATTDFLPPPRSSFNTLQPFLEYALEIPNAFVRPKLSGNYVLKVFRGSDEEDLVLTRRFLVVEQRVRIEAAVRASRDVEVRDTHQQVDLTIQHPELPISDPFADVAVVVLQNMRWDDARTGLQPRFVRSNELVYDFPSQALFAGGNEWRHFDLRNTRMLTRYVASIGPGPELLEAVLVPGEKRNIRVYFEQADLNGRQIIDNVDANGDPLGADYVNVTFTLPWPAPIPGGSVYVYGGLTDFQCRKEFRMSFSPEHGAYTLRVPVKQGLVDHQFAFLADGASAPDLTLLEGSHYGTENDYLILVYYTDPVLRCQRIVGARMVNSRRG